MKRLFVLVVFICLTFGLNAIPIELKMDAEYGDAVGSLLVMNIYNEFQKSENYEVIYPEDGDSRFQLWVNTLRYNNYYTVYSVVWTFYWTLEDSGLPLPILLDAQAGYCEISVIEETAEDIIYATDDVMEFVEEMIVLLNKINL